MMKYEINGSEIKVFLSCGNVALIDLEDEYLLKRFPKWLARPKRKYVLVYWNLVNEYGHVQQSVYLHRAVMRAKPGQHVDHRDRNPLNNKKENLRFCTHSQNMKNATKRKNKTSKYIGVSWAKKNPRNPWIVCAPMPGIRQRYWGAYSTEEEAAKEYDRLSKKHWGEFANLNFPE